MTNCPQCSSPISSAAVFCASCGFRLDDSTSVMDPATVAMQAAAVHLAAHSRPNTPHTTSSLVHGIDSGVDEGRFPPGTLLAGRYRISGLLGRGGMGEVYRASDLALGQPVALKFLPEALSRNTAMVARFYGEVRIARKVSHPNVCRVYDIGDVDGSLYISMEYVDGEDLGSLIRRIGRLPSDKATEIARKLCAGLAAAHEKGILHRDLKPANIMLDGQGQVYIMDFGLAGIADQLQGAEIRNGTPAYMAPEQLAGREVTTRSDIYSLGLVLYEIFTGRKPFEAATIAELIRLQEQSSPVSLSSVVRDLDPTIERAIVRCLSAEPAARPATALAVAAALPGGNPLAEALAAGETPSPELVAASGSTEGLKPGLALLCFGVAIVGIFAVAGLMGAATANVLGPLELSPDVLAHRAREIEAQLGYPERPPGSARSFELNEPYQNHMKSEGSPMTSVRRGPDQAIRFWVRESPLPLVQDSGENTDVTWARPPFDIPGMRRARLDPQGDLLMFEAIPQPNSMAAEAAPPDWNLVLKAAGYEAEKLTIAAPLWTPTQPFDSRIAWTANGAGFDPDLRIEAAAWKGKPVWFRVIPKWQRPQAMNMASSGAADAAYQAIQLGTLVALLIASALGAWYNVRRNRGDRRGAARIATAVFIGGMIGWLGAASHVSSASDEFSLIIRGIEIAMLFAAILYLIWLAIEPYVRRRWPQTLVAWTRVTTGNWRDPLVGADLLRGVLFGLGWAVLYAAHILIAGRYRIAMPIHIGLDTLLEGRYVVGALFDEALDTVRLSLMTLFIIFVFRVLMRKQWIAAVAYALLFAVTSGLNSAIPALDIPYNIVIHLMFIYLLTRFGLLCCTTSYFVFAIFSTYPVTLDFGVWYGSASFFAMAAVAAIAAFGFHTTLAGRALFRDELL